MNPADLSNLWTLEFCSLKSSFTSINTDLQEFEDIVFNAPSRIRCSIPSTSILIRLGGSLINWYVSKSSSEKPKILYLILLKIGFPSCPYTTTSISWTGEATSKTTSNFSSKASEKHLVICGFMLTSN